MEKLLDRFLPPLLSWLKSLNESLFLESSIEFSIHPRVDPNIGVLGNTLNRNGRDELVVTRICIKLPVSTERRC
ncbi:Hypothetical predicted protein [Mytilus galloprovincialis]|uniref:Uncharacterized protein n=1 Tax=Mytilus galloprovincialis TaxID=29158 RepID=A0A8B6EAL2_MYTGA|nr:Hypothetical predicted protein [Mytilus galloprovincialis]